MKRPSVPATTAGDFDNSQPNTAKGFCTMLQHALETVTPEAATPLSVGFHYRRTVHHNGRLGASSGFFEFGLAPRTFEDLIGLLFPLDLQPSRVAGGIIAKRHCAKDNCQCNDRNGERGHAEASHGAEPRPSSTWMVTLDPLGGASASCRRANS